MRIAKKTLWKLLLDICMLSLLVLMYQKRVISMRFHEIGGLVLFALFLLHNGLNWKWVKAVSAKVFQRSLPLRSRVCWLIDALLFLAMAATIVTGLLISKTLPTAMQGAYFVKSWHYFAAASALILTGIHLGLHGKYLRGVLLSKLPLPKRAAKGLGTVILALALVFGAYSLTASHFSAWLSGPFQVSTVVSPNHQEPSDTHVENGEHMGGKHDGAGKGGGQGLGKNAQGGALQQFSIQTVFSTMATYVSITAVFACLTVVLEKALLLLHRPKSPRQDRRAKKDPGLTT